MTPSPNKSPSDGCHLGFLVFRPCPPKCLPAPRMDELATGLCVILHGRRSDLLKFRMYTPLLLRPVIDLRVVSIRFLLLVCPSNSAWSPGRNLAIQP